MYIFIFIYVYLIKLGSLSRRLRTSMFQLSYQLVERLHPIASVLLLLFKKERKKAKLFLKVQQEKKSLALRMRYENLFINKQF